MIGKAVGIGIVISFIFTEITGLSAGLIVPGYLAFFWNFPTRIIITLLVAISTYFIVMLLSHFIIIYSRRRFMATVLVGYIIGWLLQTYFIQHIPIEQDLRIVGYIVPGLIANNMIRQGILKTITVTILVTIIVRLFLLLIIG